MLKISRDTIRHRMAQRRLLVVASVCCALLLSCPVHADITIPAGGSTSLDAGGLDLGCTDLIVGGTLQTNSAQVINVRNLVIQAGGLVDAGSSNISVGGNWSNSGTFTAGTSHVSFGDNCGVDPAVISGNTTFHDVSFATAAGKTWQFTANSTQTVQGLIDIAGTGAPLKFRSTVPGQRAYVARNGPHTTANLDDVDVVFLDPSGPTDIQPVPTLNLAGLLVLLLLLSATIIGTSSRRLSQKSTWGN